MNFQLFFVLIFSAPVYLQHQSGETLQQASVIVKEPQQGSVIQKEQQQTIGGQKQQESNQQSSQQQSPNEQGGGNADAINSLPGYKKEVNFKQYAGYLNAGQNKKLHYWLVESQRTPTKDPLLLWMNGGPGCSSLGGLFMEHGPFQVDTDGSSLTINPYSWNKIANVLYLESPAGTGFSYSGDPHSELNDDIVAQDNYMALKSFFKKFPQFAKQEFYISGESYGGVYVPTLAVKVLDDPNMSNFKLGCH